ncbi:hypothetical protein [Streptomyces sp. NPDC018693]|uniref:hypothetical protein n=1 Tax=unclassified Streptomyces TaxID=2593676 RepID=UPI0037A8B275
MTSEPLDLPDEPAADEEGRVEVRIVSMDPEAVRTVADALRMLFGGGEQRSYPAFSSGRGTRMHLTLDPGHGAGPLRSWLDSSRPPVDRTHPDELTDSVSAHHRPTGPPTEDLPLPPPPEDAPEEPS